jgi:hypothetical protein
MQRLPTVATDCYLKAFSQLAGLPMRRSNRFNLVGQRLQGL